MPALCSGNCIGQQTIWVSRPGDRLQEAGLDLPPRAGKQFDELGDIVANDLVLVMDDFDFQEVRPNDFLIAACMWVASCWVQWSVAGLLDHQCCCSAAPQHPKPC